MSNRYLTRRWSPATNLKLSLIVASLGLVGMSQQVGATTARASDLKLLAHHNFTLASLVTSNANNGITYLTQPSQSSASSTSVAQNNATQNSATQNSSNNANLTITSSPKVTTTRSKEVSYGNAGNTSGNAISTTGVSHYSTSDANGTDVNNSSSLTLDTAGYGDKTGCTSFTDPNNLRCYDPVIAEIEQENASRNNTADGKISSTQAQRPLNLQEEQLIPEVYQNTYLITKQDQADTTNRTNPLTFAPAIPACATLPQLRQQREVANQTLWSPLINFSNYLFSVQSDKVYHGEQLSPLLFQTNYNLNNVEPVDKSDLANNSNCSYNQERSSELIEERNTAIANQLVELPKSDIVVDNGKYKYIISGLPGAKYFNLASSNVYALLAKNISDALNTITPESTDGSTRDFLRVKDLVEKASEGVGFYTARTSISRKDDTYLIKIEPNYPVTIDENNIVIVRGEGTGFSKFQDLEKYLPQAGTTLDPEKFDEFTSYLSKTAQSYGYFGAEFDARHVLLTPNKEDPENMLANWLVDYYTGPRYRISNINITKTDNSIIRDDLIRNTIEINEGDYYDEAKLNKALRDLQNSRYFSLVTLRQEPNHYSNDVGLTIEVSKSLPNSVETSLGYDSSEGFRGRVLYNRLYLNQNGGKIDADTYLSKLTQKLEVTYREPWLQKPQYITSAATVSATRAFQSEALGYSSAFATSGSVSYIPVNDWQLTGSINLRHDLWFNNDTGYNSTLGYWNLILARNSLYTSVSLNLASNQLLRFINNEGLTYHAWKLNLSRIQNITSKFGIKVAAGFGGIITNNFEKLAPTLRYYTGGATSIRGYGYNSLSENNGVAGVGAKTLTEFSLELQQEIIPNLKGVVFLDAGKAADKINFKDLRYGTGVGIRYYLPVGYASFDVAYPLKTQFKWTNFKLYLGVNTQF